MKTVVHGWMERNRSLGLKALLGLAALSRLLLFPNPGYEWDVRYWKLWGLGSFDHGVLWSFKTYDTNYPLPFNYFLGFLTKMYGLYLDPHITAEYLSPSNLTYLVVMKIFILAADFGVAFLLFTLVKNGERYGFPKGAEKWAKAAALVFLLNPVTLLIGVWWGQFDSLGLFLLLLSIYLIFERKFFWGGFVYIVGVMAKPQNMIYGPVLFVFLWDQNGWKAFVKGLAGALAAFAGLNVEMLCKREMGAVLDSLTKNADYFPKLSYKAYNLWWIVARAQGMEVSDKILTIGLVNAKKLGLLTFTAGYLLAVLLLLKARLSALFPKVFIPGPDDNVPGASTRRLWLSLSLVVFCFFHCLTSAHERYTFYLTAFLLMSGLCFARRKRWMALFYGAVSLVAFYNVHTALAGFYPQYTVPYLRSLSGPAFTMGASAAGLLLFAVALTLVGNIVGKRVCALVGGMLLLAVLWAGGPWFLRRPVSLTRLSPVESRQGYGTRQSNKPVNAGFGWDYWKTLCVKNYLFGKGVGTHANSRIVYDIDGRFSRFGTTFGVDMEAGPAASAVFEIHGDAKLLYVSPKMGHRDAPRYAEVDVRGVKNLVLVTTDGGDGGRDDHTDWLNPVLYW